jgi:hypothetical protein
VNCFHTRLKPNIKRRREIGQAARAGYVRDGTPWGDGFIFLDKARSRRYSVIRLNSVLCWESEPPSLNSAGSRVVVSQGVLDYELSALTCAVIARGHAMQALTRVGNSYIRRRPRTEP